ncbi:MAG TPA: putative sulfate exporter family transporter [Phycisphaerales bacterium]|nr:putative sulfate exporter family transporter [Phycisphaerales bacterium]
MTQQPQQVQGEGAHGGTARAGADGRAPAWKIGVFLVVGVACATPWASPPIALAAGIVLALLGVTAFEAWGKKASRWLIQACIVALGLRLDLGTLAHAAWDGLALAVGTILGAVVLGLLLGRLLKTGREISTLITGGTAICGGSAIAAIGSSIRASASGMAIATGAVFVLNAVALFAFPPVARALHLTDHQFGLWAGVAIHDISSVVGAASAFDAHLRTAGGAGADAHALDTANVVKLTRVIWILPLALLAAWWEKRARAVEAGVGAGAGEAEATAGTANAPFPWFILFFLAASALRTFVPSLADVGDEIKFASGLGFQAALFLIGAALSPAALRKVGWRALVQAALLWLALAGGTLLVVMYAGV